MGTELVGVNKLNIDILSSGEGEMAFVYNILAPDLLLFASGISLSFGFMIYIFWMLIWLYIKLNTKTASRAETKRLKKIQRMKETKVLKHQLEKQMQQSKSVPIPNSSGHSNKLFHFSKEFDSMKAREQKAKKATRLSTL